MKGVLLLFLLLVAERILACSCVSVPLESKIGSADFAAVAKIVNVNPDPEDENFHDLDIEIISLFKGEKISTLKLNSMLNTSCAFYTPENTTWLIFANQNNEGELSFGFCSMSVQLDKPEAIEVARSPSLKEDRRILELRLDVLAYMKRKSISPANVYNLATILPKECLKKFNNYQTNERFAIYRITVNPDLSVAAVQAVKEFGNPELDAGLWACIRNDLKVAPRNRNKENHIPEKTDVVMMFYHHAADGEHPGFISRSERKPFSSQPRE